jgi:hypothetical protein
MGMRCLASCSASLPICALTAGIDVEDRKLGGVRAGQTAQTKPGALIGWYG